MDFPWYVVARWGRIFADGVCTFDDGVCDFEPDRSPCGDTGRMTVALCLTNAQLIIGWTLRPVMHAGDSVCHGGCERGVVSGYRRSLLSGDAGGPAVRLAAPVPPWPRERSGRAGAAREARAGARASAAP